MLIGRDIGGIEMARNGTSHSTLVIQIQIIHGYLFHQSDQPLCSK